MRVYLEAYGCSQNHGEASEIARELALAGHDVARAPGGADVGVLVTCGVIGATEARMVRRWKALAERLPRVVVTGCLVPLRTGAMSGPARERTSFVGIREQRRIPALLESWADGGAASPGTPPGPPHDGPREATAEVVIAQGCTSHCSYCFSRLARGRLASVGAQAVAQRVAAARDRGAAEVRLTSLDTACWGEDLPGSGGLPGLLRAVREVPGPQRVRVGMMSPQSLDGHEEELLELLSGPPFFRFLHLPVQSGSDAVLERMRRGYPADAFRRVVARARARLPDVTIATDVIVGFPTEREEDHRATLALLEEAEPEIVNVTRFSPRPMTEAAKLPGLPPRVAKRRSREVTESRLGIARRRLERWVGSTAEAVVVEWGPESSSVARLDNYLPVVLPGRLPLGATTTVRIDGARSTYLLGNPLAGPAPRDAAGTSK